jgi:uncharacterized membrane protein
MENRRREHLAASSRRWFGRPPERLDHAERRVLESSVGKVPVTQDTNEVADEGLTLGDRLADRVARVGGSWGFIGGFAAFLAGWAGVNLWLAFGAFDPYPFIFLNLLLSMLAAVQAPVIMMSQNRQTAKDRLAAGHDYEVNLKTEIEVMALHEKLDTLRDEELKRILALQQEQIAALAALMKDLAGRPAP